MLDHVAKFRCPSRRGRWSRGFFARMRGSWSERDECVVQGIGDGDPRPKWKDPSLDRPRDAALPYPR